jgi:hypothetical protein
MAYRIKRHQLRTYDTEARAEAYCRVLRARFPGVSFHPVVSTLPAYAFKWLIRANGRAYVGY